MARVLLIGALPPPYIGPSFANLRLSQSEILKEAFEVRFFDISDRRGASNIGQLDFGNVFLGIHHLVAFLYSLMTFRPHLVYLGVSQGFWGYVRDLAFIIPALLVNRRVVIHLRGSEFHTFYNSLGTISKAVTRWVFRRASQVIVLGNKLRHIFRDLVTDERISVVPNGIRCEDYDRPLDAPVRPQGKKILFLSSLRKRKGLMLVIEALPAILKEHPEATITFAGTWQSDDERTETYDSLQKHGLESKCKFTGEISGADKINAFLNHDLFLFPPIEPEGLPWVILEAMSARLPIVTTDQGAIAEVVVDAVTGFVTKPTPEAVSQRVNVLLSNPELGARMGAEGRLRAENHFSERACHLALKTVFESALLDSPLCVASQEQSAKVIALR